MRMKGIAMLIIFIVLIVVILIGDAWAFLTPEERGKVLWWMIQTPWVPLAIVNTDWFALMAERYLPTTESPDWAMEFPKE